LKLKTGIINKPLNIFRRKKLSRFLLDSGNDYRVKWINFEFCSACNLRCKWCSLDHEKKARFMTEDILRDCLDEITGNNHYRLERIDLHNAGETLLHPRLKEMLEIIAAKKKDLTGVSVHLLSNGVLLNEKRAKIILESQALDELRISIDGGTRKDYEQIRSGSDWDLVKDNFNDFIRLNDGTIKTGIICMVSPEKPLSTEWMDREFVDLFDKVDSVELRHPHNWDGSEDLNLPPAGIEKPAGRICKMLIKNLVILPDGDVTVCCADLNSRGVVGNLARSSLTDIYFSDKRLKIIDLYAGGNKSRIDLCRNCAGYYEADSTLKCDS